MSAAYWQARRAEQDAFRALANHSAECIYCLRALLKSRRYGIGCEEGRDLHLAWQLASHAKLAAFTLGEAAEQHGGGRRRPNSGSAPG